MSIESASWTWAQRTPYSLTQQVKGRELVWSGFQTLLSTAVDAASCFFSERLPQRMKSFSLSSAKRPESRRKLLECQCPLGVQGRKGRRKDTYSPASSLSKNSPSAPETNSFICARGWFLGMDGSTPSTRRQKRHSQTMGMSSSLPVFRFRMDVEGTFTAKSSRFGGKKSTTRTMGR